MEENEDESDVKQDASVEEGVPEGEVIDDSGRSTTTMESASRPHHADKESAKKSKDSCPKTVTVWVYDKECTLPKTKPIPRHCLTKKEHINILATPSRKCPVPSPQREVSRKVRPVSTRIFELAQPPKLRLQNTLQDRAGTLPIELVDNLMRSLEGDECVSPEQAERMLRDKVIRPKKKCPKRKKKKCCKASKRSKHEAATVQSKKSEVSSIEEEVPVLDKGATNCQYLMSESFLKSILEWRCPIPREKFKDIAEVILERLGRVTQYSPDEDRKVQQMQLLADIVASWISGVLCEVAETRKTKFSEYSDEEEEEEEEDKDKKSDKEEKDKKEDDEGPGKPDDGGEGKGGGDDGKQIPKDAEDELPEDEEPKEPEEPKPEDDEPKPDAEAPQEDEEYHDARDESIVSLEEKKTPTEEPEEPEDEPEDKSQSEISVETVISVHKDEEAIQAEEPPEVEENIDETGVDEILEESEEPEETPTALDENITLEESEEPEEPQIEPEELRIEPEEPPFEPEEPSFEPPEEMPIEPETVPEIEPSEPPDPTPENSPVDASPEDSPALASLQESLKELPAEEPTKIVETLPELMIRRSSSKTKPSKIPSSIVVKKKTFQTDTPFVTFDKIFHTIYNAIEASRENPGADPITNRLHRAVYEKCSNVVQEEKSEPLPELTKDVLEVLSGKIALWLRDILTDSQLSFINKTPATVESVDVREWSAWIDNVTHTADTWSNWINKTIKETEAMRSGKVSRGDWLDWTKSVDKDALLWRRFYVQSLHQAHQNLTMIRDRKVVKTGTRVLPDDESHHEREMETVNLETAR